MATDAVQLEPKDAGTSGGPSPVTPISSYRVMSNAQADKSRADELYSFRSEIQAAQPDPNAAQQPKKPASPLVPILTIGAVVLAVIALFVLVSLSFPKLSLAGSLTHQKPPALYMDLGNRRLDSAGLAGRLIVKWEDKAGYEFYLDPLDQSDTAGFQTLAKNPPRPLSVVIRLLDTQGMVACQKEIDFPGAAQPGAPPDPTQALLPKTTAAGDTVRDMAGSDGEIAEINSSGPLPCPLKAYQSIVSWDFATNSPSATDQETAAKQANTKSGAGSRNSRFGSGWRLSAVRLEHLSAPIEGDDVIVGDNPGRGTVDTSSGREFMLGAGALSSEWQIFPSAVHFRCERTGTCTLTRSISHAIVQARLVR